MPDQPGQRDDQPTRLEEIADDLLPPPRRSTDDRKHDQAFDFSKPPTGHEPGEGAEGEHDKKFGPRHMREELNPTEGRR